jgi:uncharacterized protein YbjT (DUF2867 family)
MSETSGPAQQSETILVTGATGNIGSIVVESLLSAGEKVRAAGTNVDAIKRRFGDSVEPVVLNFTDSSTWPGAFRGVTQMFLMRPPALGKPKTQMLPSLEAAQSAGVRQMVLLSLQGAEHNKVVPHYALEQWLRSSEVDWTFVRPSFFMQNLTTTHLTDIRERDEIMVPAGRGATAFVDASDVAAVAVQALLAPSEHRHVAWTPTGPEALTYDQIADNLTRVLGRRIVYRHPGVLRYARHARKTLGMPWGMVAVTTAIYSVARFGSAAGLTNDVLTVTGREPVSFADFAAREQQLWSR